MSLIQKIFDEGILGELWLYLTTNDICHLLVINKNVRTICLNINNIIGKITGCDRLGIFSCSFKLFIVIIIGDIKNEKKIVMIIKSLYYLDVKIY